MKACHVPSPTLLCYLARLTDRSIASHQVTHAVRSRGFSCSRKRPAARSPRAQSIARDPRQGWAAKSWNPEDRAESLEPFQEVLKSKWVRQDFANQLDILTPNEEYPLAEMVVVNFLWTMKNQYTPAETADWFTGKKRTTDAGLSKHFEPML